MNDVQHSVAEEEMDVLPVSVAISTYNRAELLKICLNSVFNSTAAPAEVLVMDDGSVDNTAETVASFGEKVKYFYQHNQGLAAARNALTKLASSRYIIFFDDDDVMLPEALQLLYEAVSKHTSEGPAAAYGQYVRINSEGVQQPTRLKKESYPSGKIVPVIFETNLILPSATLLDREYMIGKNMFFPLDVKVCEDYKFMLEYALEVPFYAVNKPIVERRRHSSNMSVRSSAGAEIQFDILHDFYSRHPEIISEIPLKKVRRRFAQLKIRAARSCSDKVQRRAFFAQALGFKFSLKALWGYLFS